MNDKLTIQFLRELFRLCFLKKSVLEIVTQHLKYQYVPDELRGYKFLLKGVTSHFSVYQTLPTFGIISQMYYKESSLQDVLKEVKDTPVADEEIVLNKLEEYIKRVRFQLMNMEIVSLYNSDKQDEAIQLSHKQSEEIVNFSVRCGSSKFVKVFGDFDARMKQRQVENESGMFGKEKIPFGIDELDALTYGGLDTGDTALFVARSGVGKSTVLKSIGMHAARLGYSVLHFQLEGSEDECFTKYAQTWSAQPFYSLRMGEINEKYHAKIEKIIRDMTIAEKDIYIYAFEQFDEPTCVDIRKLIGDYQKEKGKVPDLVIIDSIDLLHPGDGLRYGFDTQSVKMKKQNSAKKLKNICNEFSGMRLVTADQASDIPIESWNRSEFVITRNDISGDKNLPNSFSYFFTLNQTVEEYRANTMRIYVDKLRNYKAGQTISIATAYNYGRFYDRNRTQKLFPVK